MQDLHTTGTAGATARFLAAGDRRLRPHNNHQSLKCPRCDSPNTKFCYYNNYNLSQPRHFCKSCRRYWTKGGVLRNVPVGGGCRKSKRAKIKNDDKERKSSEKSSSSESSSLTAAVTEEVTVTVNVNVNVTVPPIDDTAAFDYPDSSFFNQSYLSNNQQQLTVENNENNQAMDGQIFAAEMGSFTSLINSEEKMVEFGVQTASFGVKEDPTVEIGGGLMSSDGFGAVMDWGTGGGDQGLFDLTAGVDPSYWSQTQWTDTDQSLNYLP